MMKDQSTHSWPQIAVVGAGSVGGYFGAMLARAGAPVVLIGRPDFVAAASRDGLVIDSPRGEMRVAVNASTELAAASRAEVILLCVKTSDTASVARELSSVIRPGARVVSLQNGVDNVERIRAASGIEAVAAAVYIAVAVIGPGRIRHLARGDLVVGPEGKEIADLFSRAGIPCVVSSDLPGALWTKLSTNCALNALSALTGRPYGQIIAVPEGQALIHQIVGEVSTVAHAAGIESSILNPETLAQAVFDLARQMPTTVSSTAQDLQRGRRTEIDSLNGYVSLRGAELGVPTSANDLLRSLIRISEIRKSG